MKKFLLPAVAISFSVLALSLFAPSAAYAQRSLHSTTKVETYMVVKIIDDNKAEDKDKIEYRAISASQFKDEEKRVKDDNALKLKEWHDLRKTDPTAPMPKKIIIKKIPRLTGYQTQKIAQEAADKLKDEEANKDNAGAKPADLKK